ncbi:MAG: iron chelate uptake ABC transporter family permease subunit [Nocardioides sp.]
MALAGVALMLGDIRVSPSEVVAVLTGHDDGPMRMVLLDWRAPRVCAAVLFGAALGVGGAVFQGITGNPLGSPDVIGLTTGSFTGVVTVLWVGGTGAAAISGGALAGGLLTAAGIYLLAARGGVSGFRFIIVGIAVNAFLTSINTWFATKVDVDLAMEAAVWGAGTLALVDWSALRLAAAVLAGVALLVLPAQRTLRQLELGDDLAAGLGIRVERARLGLLTLGVVCVVLVSASAGPISFVALAAPHLARRLAGRGAPLSLPLAGLMGALLLLAADVVAQHAVPNVILPVGAVTVTIGGLYLVWLLAIEARRR